MKDNLNAAAKALRAHAHAPAGGCICGAEYSLRGLTHWEHQAGKVLEALDLDPGVPIQVAAARPDLFVTGRMNP